MKILFSLIALVFSAIVVNAQPTVISGVVNSYTKVTSINYCTKTLGVTSTAGFSAGDKAIIIQMKGAEIDTANSSNFGSISGFNEAGNFEFVTIESITANNIRLKYLLGQNYNPNGAVQLVRLPKDITTAWVQGDPLTAPAWDGSTGGVLALEAQGAIDIRGSIDVSGKGFRGGDLNTGSIIQYNLPDYKSAITANRGGGKGESIIDVDSFSTASRGAPANGGGGGNQHNAGGGGGANGGNGGMGGREYYTSSPGLLNGGVGGHKLDFIGLNPKIFMGGGGGAGHQNDGVGTKGVAGGGIVILKTGVLVGRGNIIAANGNSQTINAQNDGAGGGGGGGTVFLHVDRITSPVRVEAYGGKGGNSNNSVTQGHGTGGGGGGGWITVSSGQLLDSIIPTLNGGNAGIILNTTNTFAAEAGQAGGTKIGWTIPESNLNPVIAQVAKDTVICPGGVASIGKRAIGGRQPYSYSWSPSLGLDNSSAEFPNASPLVSTPYTVTVTDSTGCKNQAQVYVRIHEKQIVSAGTDTAVCLGASVQLQANGRGIFQWTPLIGLNNSTIANPIATPTATTDYHLIVIDSNGCMSEDSMTVIVYPLPIVSISTIDTSICDGESIVISASGNSGATPYSYVWSPSTGVSDVRAQSPVFSPKATTSYSVTVIDANGCIANSSVTIHISPLPNVDAGASTNICYGDTTQLSGTGGISFSWSPSLGLSSTTIANPLAFPTQTMMYYLTSKNSNGCVSTDSVLVTVYPLPQIPVLTIASDTITSTVAYPVKQYMWSLDGVLIPFQNQKNLIAKQSGKYSLTVIDMNGCLSASLPIDVTLGSGTLALDDMCAYPGEIVHIPIRLLDALSVTETNATDIEMTLRFNSTILLPLGQDFLDNRVENGERIVRFRTPIVLGGNGLLRTMKFGVALGNDTATTIRITDYSSIGGRIYLSADTGVFCVLGICREGGARLYSSNGSSTSFIFNNPLPSEKTITLTMKTWETGITKLTIINILGQTISIPLNEFLIKGEHSIELDVSKLNIGTYLLILQTPNEYVARVLHIQK
ncbi:MAG: hypothetical protein HYZ54_06925 [Ignavibacteriae bacterium]|nr:hypothetical protein [Ignavibacteriota bacterium]